MNKVYACLLGNWVCLNDDPECVMSTNRVSPSRWFKEGSSIYAPLARKKADSYCELDYIHIFYKNKDYRINPIFIQIVNE